MRTIKFRGKIKAGTWIYGSLLTWPDGCCKIYDKQLSDGSMAGLEVEPSTVGQFTGLRDKKGTEIYEGDIFRLNDHHIRYVVEYEEGVFHGKQIGSSSYVGLPYWLNDVVIVGNKYDNPELLKKII